MNLLLAAIIFVSSAPGQLEGEEPPVRVFANEIASFDCALRTFKGEPAWYHVSFAAAGYEILLECEEGPDGTGSLKSTWLVVGPKLSEPKELHLPGLGYFSNPSVCGTRVAYWRWLENDTLSGVIAELDRGEILAEEDLGIVPIETDFRFHYALPVWKESCRIVEFQDGNITKVLSANDG